MTHSWAGDRLTLEIAAMGQAVTAHCDVEDGVVRAEIALPFMLGLFSEPIAAAIRSQAPKLLT